MDDVEKNVLLRILSYDGLEFSIESSFYQENSQGKKIDDIKTARETVRLHFPKKGPSWKYWVQEIQDSFDKTWIHNRFKVTNIIETRNFVYAPEAEGQWSHGGVIPWYQWDEEEGRNFFTFLGMNSMGIPLFSMDDGNDAQKLMKQFLEKQTPQYVGEGMCDGVKTMIFHCNDGVVVGNLHITIPHALIVLLEGNGIKEKFSTVYRVEQIGHFESVIYPQKGKLSQTAIRYQNQVDYKFDVTNVHRFDKKLIDNWFPEWSPSTIVVDTAYDKTTRIPPSERQLKKVAEQWRSSYKIEPRPMTWTVFRIIIAVIGTVMILTALYLLWKRKK
jgi:hypothetical protein